MSKKYLARPRDPRKQSLYFTWPALAEIQDEAARLDRSASWVVQRAWKLARGQLRRTGPQPAADARADASTS